MSTDRLKILNSYINKLKRHENIPKRDDDLNAHILKFNANRPVIKQVLKVLNIDSLIQDIKIKKSMKKFKEFPQEIIKRMIESNDTESLKKCLNSFPKFFLFPLKYDYCDYVNDFDMLVFLVDNQIISKQNINKCASLYTNFNDRYWNYLFENNMSNINIYIHAFNNFWFEPFENFKKVFKNNLILTINNSNYYVNNIAITYTTLVFLLDNKYQFESISYLQM